ncbi:MAG: hypothetical protein EBR01_04060 [Proteobacteria bacterium]|nr:hypothetical protein [Pseudomonadota bacterium]
MNRYLIVGGGITGIIMGRILSDKGLTFQGLEKSRRIGRDFTFGQLRIHQDNHLGLIKSMSDAVEWTKIDDQPKERKKGEWVSSSIDFTDEEKAFLGNPFYRPTVRIDTVVQKITSSVENLFSTEKLVEKIDLAKKIAYCQDGSEFSFDHLLWCADLKSLIKVMDGSPKTSIKTSKKNEDSQGGIHLELELKNQCIPFSNSVIFPFRYKDYKLRAIGINDQASGESETVLKMHWLVFVERELAEDREEVAKVIRALKRELFKEFPDLKLALIKEKIVFQPKVETHRSSEAKGLELYPNVFYVGPEVHLSDTTVESSPLDLILENCKRVGNTLSQGSAEAV